MQGPPYSLRRATLDDLGDLKLLWARVQLPVVELERHLTDFQLAVDEGGKPVAAIGLRIEAKQGRIYSEAFAAPDQTDPLRGKLWERLQTVAKNHGLVRLWTRERGDFWTKAGFEPASPESKQKLPTGFGDPAAGWLTKVLRDETAMALSLDQELALYRQSQREATDRMMRQGKFFKVLSWILLAGFVVFAIAAIIFGLRKRFG